MRMKKFTEAQFEKAIQFIKTYANDIDCAMFEYYFESKSLEAVIDVLAAYQNEDGGFRMLDYDIEYPGSCLKSTESACRYIYQLENISVNHPMIKKLIRYLIDNYNRETGCWNNLLVPEVNDYPRAPWWNYEYVKIEKPINREELIAYYNANTNAALAGIIVKYKELVPEDLANEIKSIVIEKIMSSQEFGQYDMMSYQFFLRGLEVYERNPLLDKLMGNGKLISLLDENGGTESAYKLSNWIDTPHHPYYQMYKNDVIAYLEYLIDTQELDGSWAPNWSWGGAEGWDRANQRLKGVLAVQFLKTIHRFSSELEC